MFVLGIDLAGPANAAETAFACFRQEGESLLLVEFGLEADDERLWQLGNHYCVRGPLFIGLDAPLSYNAGGGSRSADTSLRQKIVAAGLAAGSVMAPTFNRMVYLSLRGLAVARFLSELDPAPQIAEVHPGAVMALRGAPREQIKSFKRSETGRRQLLGWLEEQGLKGAAALESSSDHLVAACAAALGTWHWALGRPAWLEAADPPFHPFDYIA